VAHERVLRGEAVPARSTDGLPDVLDLPYKLAAWEPSYALATYHDDGGEFPAPPLPARMVELALPAAAPERLDDDAVELALRQLVEPWTTSSNGRAEVVVVEGDAAGALRALGLSASRAAPLSAAEGVAWLAWAGASGGAHGRRPGAAAGRFGALWLVAAIVDVLDEWPVPLDDLGALAADLRWWWWDASEPVTGWQVQLVVEAPTEGVAWAISVRDAA
jgi:hypothetical protein